MTALTAYFHRAPGRSPRRAADLAKCALTTLRDWHNRSVQRRELATLPRQMLEDIGLDPVDALVESQKPFWVE